MFWAVAGFMAVLGGGACLEAEPAQEPPGFKEVYELVRSNLAGVSDAQLNRAAVQGLIAALGPKVSLVTNVPSSAPASTAPLVGKPNLFDREIAYLRIGRVEEGLAKQLRESYQALASTNRLKGVVIDLRYADGGDYGSAAETGDLFVKKERPLLNWGNGVIRSHEKSDAIAGPVAVLVNHQTARAAEALAAILRETGTGLVLGNQTAGQAMIAQEFPLSNGEKLRISTASIEVGEGSAFPLLGLVPDITVEVSAEDERVYYADAFKAVPRPNLVASASLSLSNQVSLTNRPTRRPRFNEAELVRERREGVGREADNAPERDDEPEIPVVHDPALARAIDLLKGLAVVRQSRF
jgi:Peptidase family S41